MSNDPELGEADAQDDTDDEVVTLLVIVTYGVEVRSSVVVTVAPFLALTVMVEAGGVIMVAV